MQCIHVDEHLSTCISVHHMCVRCAHMCVCALMHRCVRVCGDQELMLDIFESFAPYSLVQDSH